MSKEHPNNLLEFPYSSSLHNTSRMLPGYRSVHSPSPSVGLVGNHGGGVTGFGLVVTGIEAVVVHSHNVTTLDLPASGINQTQQQQLHSFSDYAEPLFEFLGSLQPKEKGILVGHSMEFFLDCDQDLSIEEDVQMWMIEKNLPNQVKVINGSDHMVMFSRPLELFSNLLQVAEKYA
ncbi:methylesterase 4 [Rosa chinensis]|uniref:methylesterase 4 n=1 Tax=Rosa chinensis TaxID=74649 RepID=UPI000D096940|nr:methylesterase 4 [Rosa chinensis]